MSKFKYYLETVNSIKSEKILVFAEKVKMLESDILNWTGTADDFMELIKNEWTKGWDTQNRPATEAIDNEFKRVGNTYYITLLTPASSESDRATFGRTTVDKFLAPDKIKENIADAQRRDVLLMALHFVLNKLTESKSLPKWIKSFKKDDNTLKIEVSNQKNKQ